MNSPWFRSLGVFLCIVSLCSGGATLTAQTSSEHIDGLRTKKQVYVALLHCTLVPAPGQKVEDATIIIHNDRIEAAGAGISVPPGATTRDVHGAWVYAGFVESYCNAGLGAMKQAEKPMGDDDDEGPVSPKVQGAKYWNQAVNPQNNALDKLTLDEKTAEELRKCGITVAQTNSMDGIFRGASAIILARQGQAADISMQSNVMQWISFRKGTSKTPYPSSLMGSIALIRQTFYDAQWYAAAHAAFDANHSLPEPEFNVGLEALAKAMTAKQTFVFETENEHSVMRAHAIGEEFQLNILYEGSGFEYRRLPSLVKFHPRLLLPVAFPGVPDVSTSERALDVSYDDLLHWDAAPENARLCDSAGLDFAFTTHQLKNKEEFLPNIRKAVHRGLKPDVALAALTTRPAEYLGIADRVGKVQAGYLANLVLCSHPLFDEECSISAVYVAGNEYSYENTPDQDLRGAWTVKPESVVKPFHMTIAGTISNPSAHAKHDSADLHISWSVRGSQAQWHLNGDSVGSAGTLRFSGTMDSLSGRGTATLADGRVVNWTAKRDSVPQAPKNKKDSKEESEIVHALAVHYPNTAFGFDQRPAQRTVLIKNATVWTCAKDGILKETDVLIKNGLISAIGKNLSGGDTVIDASGKDLSPGIIDEHSHIAIEQGVNEGTHAVTSEVRIGDVVFPDDISLYRQLSGGVTTSHLLHGSANPIGGQLQLIKLRWGEDADGLKFKEAPGTIKFALGENVKQSNWGDRYTVRYPQTRMGVDEIMRDGFRAALEYEYQRDHPSKTQLPVRRDLQLDALEEIIKGQRFIHCHSYVQSEILMLMRLAEDFHFTVRTFTHILEGYKVAREMKDHGAMASSFADWWAYKYEVTDAIPQNTGILHEQGVITSVNSDDGEMARRLNQEAAKAVKYGGVSQEEAMKMCTINSAIQLGVDKLTGSIEVGKQADLVLWSGNPLSNFSRVLQTYVDGRLYFDLNKDHQLRERDQQNRAILEQRALKALAGGAEKASGPIIRHHREYDCNDMEDEVKGSEE